MIEQDNKLYELPKGWAWAKLGELAEIVYGKNLATKNLKLNGFPVFGANGIIGFYDQYLYEEEQLLISCRGANSGNVNISPPKCFITNNSLVVQIQEEDPIMKRFIFYLLQNVDKRSLVTGSAQPQVTINNAIIVSICLPPLPEQQRIVAKIEELFTKLDAGIETMKKIRLQLKRYRQSVLKSAFEGKLTAEWREAHKGELEPASELLERIKAERKRAGKYKELPPLDTTELPELPEGWALKPLEECSEILDGQRVPVNSSEREKRIGNIPYYGATGQVGWIDDYLFDEELVLLGEDGAPFLEPYKSKAYIIDGKSWVNNHAHVLKAIKKILLNRLLCYYLNSIDYHNYISGTTRYKLNQASMRKIPIPLPPLSEQLKIVEEIERHFSIADKIEATIEQSLKQSERLRQSILKQAFEGKLVPQDPSDEPAEKLLERIKAEKAHNQTQPKRRRTSNGK